MKITSYNREIKYYINRPFEVKLTFGVAQLNLSPLQMKRFKFLAEERYDEKKDEMSVSVTHFLEAEDNKARAFEIV